MSSVISEYVNGDLGSWSVRAVAIYANGSRLRRLTVMLRACYSVLRLSPRRTAGVHLHVSQNFDLFRCLLLVFLARLRGLSAVATIHSAGFLPSARTYPRVASRLMRSVGVVTALDEETAAAARALGARSAVSLPNPMSFGPKSPSVPRRAKTVLFAGEVGRRKGVDTLLAAWPHVQHDHVSARLRLLGPVVDETVLEPRTADVAIEGPQTRAVVRAALEEAAIAVLPSRAEGLPMFILEAMAAGIPVVATPVGAVADAVGDAGIVVPVDDPCALAAAISELLADPYRADTLGRRGMTKVLGEYAAATVLPKFAQLYANAFSVDGRVAQRA